MSVRHFTKCDAHRDVLVLHFDTDGSFPLSITVPINNARLLADGVSEGIRQAGFPNITVLPLGHTELVQRVERVETTFLDESALYLRLLAQVEAHPDRPPGPAQHQGATSVAIRMDRAVAMTLVKQICDLAKEKGWPLPKLD